MPTIGDYDDAIRAGRIRFKDPTLRAATLELNKRPVKGGFIEEPWRSPGSFAVAYKMRLATGRMRAIRCYFAEHTQHSYRYSVLHRELPARLQEYTVEFRYLDQGIRVESGASAPYLPIVDMEWVQGRELRQYVAHIADNRDIPRLTRLAEAWLTLMQRMRAAQVAHGDLSGNNIMARDDGSLVLIDYDGMYTPTLANTPSNEAGAPEYQHPTAQNRRRYGPEMDRFSALLIYVVLRALQERPALWRAHSEYNPSGDLASDRMLFSAEDLKAPATSAVFRELATLRDPLTRKLVATLRQACLDDITRTPWVVELADPLITLKAAIASDNDQDIVAAASDAIMAQPGAHAYDQRIETARRNMANLPVLRRALHDGDDDKIGAIWNTMSSTVSTRQLAPQANAAVQRADLTQRLRDAIQDLDYPAIKQIEERLHRMERGAEALKPYEKAIQDTYVRYGRLDAIKRALFQGNDQLAVHIWDLAASDQQGVFKQRLAQMEESVRQARERLAQQAERHALQQTLVALQQALDAGDLSEAAHILDEHNLWDEPAAAPHVQRYNAQRAQIERADPNQRLDLHDESA